MLFTCLLAAAVTLLFALLPALGGALTLTEALRGHHGAIRGGLRNLLHRQVTVSLVLLIVATTIVRNGAAIRGIDLGMQTAGVISMRENRATARRSAAATSR